MLFLKQMISFFDFFILPLQNVKVNKANHYTNLRHDITSIDNTCTEKGQQS